MVHVHQRPVSQAKHTNCDKGYKITRKGLQSKRAAASLLIKNKQFT